MTAREDFTDDEWYRLRSAPWQAAMGVIEIDPSGGVAEGREVEAVEAGLAAKQFDEDLIGIVTRDLLDLDAGVLDEGVAPSAGPTAAAQDSATTGDAFPDLVIVAMTEVRQILDAKAPGESEAFRAWLLELATEAARAGKEGFAGITGPRVSDEESGYLTRLREALGV